MTKRTWIVENSWKCDSCSNTNFGRFMACQKCGSPKEKHEVDVVPSPSAAAVTDPELLRLARQKANWFCEFCGGQVRDEHGKCVSNCGAPKPLPPLPTPIKFQSVGRFETTSVLPRQRVREIIHVRPPLKRSMEKPLYVGVAVAAFTGLVWLGIWLTASHEELAKVTALEWSYRQDLRQRTTRHGEDWGSPIGAFNVSCERKFYGIENCRPHDCRPHSVSYDCNCTSYECNCRQSCRDNGNGFSTCSESCSTCQRCQSCSRTEYDTCYDSCNIYKDWCGYDFYEWPIIDTKTTTGISHDEHWAGLKVDGPLQRVDQRESYLVRFAGQEPLDYRPTSLAEFKYFNVGVSWRVLVNHLGMVQPQQALASGKTP